MPTYSTITVEELKAKRDAGEKLRLIDVREPHEHQHASIAGAELKPLGQIAQWMNDLPTKTKRSLCIAITGCVRIAPASFWPRKASAI